MQAASCRLLIFGIVLLFSRSIYAQQSSFTSHPDPLISVDSLAQRIWVDSVFQSLTVEQRIGQLFMVDLFSRDGIIAQNRVTELARAGKIGGVIFSKGGPKRQSAMTDILQQETRTPLLIAIDAEWGLAMRLDSTFAFPYNMTLGAISDTALVKEVGRRVGEHNRRMGVHVNFAPDVDVNNNPANPIIGNRSFGEDRERVAVLASAFAEGMQSEGVLANIKHFPGHGDTDKDSHKTLPTLDFSRERLDSLELYPFKKMFKTSVASVMVAHLNVPSLESRPGYPTSLSNFVVTDLLKNELGFNGLIFTDALNMKGASRFTELGEIELQAFKAGNDVLLIPNDINAAIKKIRSAIAADETLELRLQESVEKILKAKYLVGLSKPRQKVFKGDIYDQLNRVEDSLVYQRAMLNAQTLVKNDDNLLPLKNLDTKKVAYVQMGDDGGSIFLNQLRKYTKVDLVQAEKLDELLTILETYNTVIIGHHRSDANPWKDYKLTDKELTWIYEIARKNRVVLDLFVSPYVLSQFKTVKNINAIVVSYQNSPISQRVAAQLIFGGQPYRGLLPVTAGKFKVGDGLQTTALGRLSYSYPEDVGMDGKILSKIDSIAYRTINDEGTPGIQILVARHGKVIYDRSFGHHTYSRSEPVYWNDLYDLASLTKILATLPLIMELVEKGILSMDTTLGEMLPELLAGTDKQDITLQQALSHYARLKPWIPFHFATLDSLSRKRSNKYYSSKKLAGISTSVAERIYVKDDFRDSILNTIANSKLRRKKEYKYSDLPYYLMQRYLEKYYNRTLEELVQRHFYNSMGIDHLGFHPLDKFPKAKIIPTELDTVFREQLVHGYVHDQGAALMGGVGGHAGLFSNANDVAKMMQMYLQGGYYGGERYLSEQTIDLFNTCYYCDDDVRRGVGFDKPQLEEFGPTCGCVSMSSFGHSGFTGTYTWADPEVDIVYVFLSNRIHPSPENRYLIKENVRTDIQQIIYDSIIREDIP